MAKLCKFGCETQIEWNDEQKKFYESGTNTIHGFKRCAELLKQQGKQIPFPKEKYEFKPYQKRF